MSLAKPRTAQERIFIALSRRRTQQLQLVSQESNRLRQSYDSTMHGLIKEMLDSLKTQLKSVDTSIEKSLAEQAKTDSEIDVLLSVPAVGVAPIIKQFGKMEQRRRARGGRGSVRRVLYMSALVATQKNPVINRFYIRLLKQSH